MFSNEAALFDFARAALTQFHLHCHGAIVDGGLNRVDIMCMSNGSLVVNEFESLEAFIPAAAPDMAKAQVLMHEYWLAKLNDILTA